jgi:hypothetical protein
MPLATATAEPALDPPEMYSELKTLEQMQSGDGCLVERRGAGEVHA